MQEGLCCFFKRWGEGKHLWALQSPGSPRYPVLLVRRLWEGGSSWWRSPTTRYPGGLPCWERGLHGVLHGHASSPLYLLHGRGGLAHRLRSCGSGSLFSLHWPCRRVMVSLVCWCCAVALPFRRCRQREGVASHPVPSLHRRRVVQLPRALQEQPEQGCRRERGQRSCMANVRQIRIGSKHGMISPSTT
jgi:hypothetical protein